MECNREEALRAKEIAEKKLSEKDIRGAKKFAVKAQNLNPGLDGISQMMKTLDVYIAAEKKINGEGNWYGILGLDRVADEDAVRKQFRKLALLLHPDKNQTVGAEGAFKIISEAWTLLSDKNKKLAYDQRIAAAQNGSKNPDTSSAHMQSGFYDFTKKTSPHMKVPKAKSDKGGPSSVPSSSAFQKQEKHTFWTVCHQCKMQYEYLKIYRNKNLLCPNCHVAFLAVKIPSPSSEYSKRSVKSHQSQQQKNLHRDEVKKKASSNNKGNPSIPNGRSSGISSSHINGNDFQWVPFSSNTSGMSATQAATMVQQAYEKVRREREEAQSATKREQLLHKERKAHKRASGSSTSGYFDTMKKRKVPNDCSMNDRNKRRREGISMANTSSLSGHGNGAYGPDAARLFNSKDACHVSIKKLLIDKAKKDIKNRLIEQNSSEIPTMVQSGRENSNGHNIDNGMALNKSNFEDELDTSSHDSTADYVNCRRHNYILQQSSIVPDSDFYDFGRKRLEETFGENQAWAAYDGNDGMPRCYVMIHKVISLFPFKIQIKWLNSKSDVKFGLLSHAGCGFLKTTGDFGLGRREIIESIDCFSHEVKWNSNACGTVQIFPRKGDVWALYRNWSAGWDEFTDDEVIRKYDLVEILEDHNGEGLTVIPLIKVAGYKALFHRHLDLREIRRIPTEEVFRFSHHVPSYMLTGNRFSKVPIGCRELDPSATPSELLEVMMDAKEELMEVDGVEYNDDTIKKEYSNQSVEELVSTKSTKSTKEEFMEVDGVEYNDDTIRKEHSNQSVEELVST